MFGEKQALSCNILENWNYQPHKMPFMLSSHSCFMFSPYDLVIQLFFTLFSFPFMCFPANVYFPANVCRRLPCFSFFTIYLRNVMWVISSMCTMCL